MKVLYWACSRKLGLIWHLISVAIELKKQGYDIIVINNGLEQDLGNKKLLEDVDIPIIGIEKCTEWSSFVQTCKELARLLKNHPSIEIIHVMGIQQLLVCYLARKYSKSNAKIIYSVHSARHGEWYSSIAFFITSKIANYCADIILPVSNFWGQILIKHGLEKNKCFPVHNAIKVSEFNKTLSCNRNKNNIVIGYAANMIKRKGHIYILKALSQVVERYKSIQLVLIGDGILRPKIENYIKKLNLQKNVKITGWVSRDKVPTIMKEWDIALMPSLSETFGHALIEPMSIGIPVIATMTGVGPELLRDGENSLLVPFKSSKAIVKALIRLIENPVFRKKLGRQGQKDVLSKYSLNMQIKKTEYIYKKALKDISKEDY